MNNINDDAGGWNGHSLGVLISNKFGNYGGIKDVQLNDYSALGADEALIPFCNSMDSGRLIMAVTHLKQAIPIKNADQPLVSTGAEYIVPALTSNKFVHLAKYDGEVITVKEKESITVKYNNGRIETFDIQPRFSSTKRNSTIMINMNHLNLGSKFKKDQLISWSSMFNGECFTQGKNLKCCIMNYNGISFEDGYVISQEASAKFETDVLHKITAVVPPDVKVLKINTNLYGETTKNEVLLEFQYVEDIQDYIELYDLNDNNPEVDGPEENTIFAKGGNTLKTLSPGGEIVSISIKINNTKKVDPVLITAWKGLVKELQRKHKELTKNAQSQKETLSDNMDMSILKTGLHKYKSNFFEGAVVEYLIRAPKIITKGDKLSNRMGAKGTCTGILSKEDTPKGEFSGNIDIFLPSCGVLGRKTSSAIRELYIGKIMYNLQNQISERAKKGEKIQSIKDTIINIYDLLDPTSDKRILNSVKSKLLLPDDNLKKIFIDNSIKFTFMCPPFNIPTFNNIKHAADILNIPLDEKVFIPELNTWTKLPVPVGYMYYSSLEQFADDYESSRGEGSYNSKTGQPTVGKSRGGGQSIGGLDLFAFLSYDAIPILNELLISRSDNIQVKRQMLTNLRMTGASDLIKDAKKGQTKQLMDNLFRGLGLDIVE